MLDSERYAAWRDSHENRPFIFFPTNSLIEFNQRTGENKYGYVVYDRIHETTKKYVGSCDLSNELSVSIVVIPVTGRGGP
jgi:hypothetical protein